MIGITFPRKLISPGIQASTHSKRILKLVIFLGILGSTLPFWLPDSLGGDISLQFVLTGSMKGELGPGSLALVRRSNNYQVGDIAAYKLFHSEGHIVVIHRIVGRLPDGGYIFKGDANRGTETVAPAEIMGKLVLGVPGLGFVPGAISAAPILLGILALAPFLFGRAKEPSAAQKKRSLFFPALLAVAITLPFYSVGLAERLGVLQASILILTFLVGVRVIEVTDPWPEFRFLPDLGYILIVALAVLMVSIPGLMDSLEVLRAEF